MPFLRLTQRIAHNQRNPIANVFDVKPGRVIAQGRLVLCALSLVAIYVDPTHPAVYAKTTFVVLGAYLAFAALMMVICLYTRLGPLGQYVALGIDLIFISTLTFLTDGSISPFFVFFSFVLLSASLRWGWATVAGTAAVLAGILIIATFTQVVTPADNATHPLDLNRAIIRAGYIVVAGAMFAFVGAFRELTTKRLHKLAEWPAHDTPDQQSATLAETLAHASAVLEAPRALAVWEDAEEPFVNIALWQRDGYRQTRKPAGKFGDLIAPECKSAVFVTDDVVFGVTLMQRYPTRERGCLLDQELIETFQMRSVASAPFAGSSFAGRVFFCDRGSWSDDHMLLTKIVASPAPRVAADFDRARK